MALIYCIAGNFWGRNFREFYSFVAIHKSFLRKIGGVASFGVAKVSNLQKFSLQKVTNSRSFLPQNFPLYGSTKRKTNGEL